MSNRAARDFEIGQEVLITKVVGKIATSTGPLIYTVDVGEQTWRHHVDQILDAQPKNDTSPSPDAPLSDDYATTINMPPATETLAPDKIPATPKAAPQVQRRYT